jgi:hypothetical protein
MWGEASVQGSGFGMWSRTFDGQRVEVQLASKILNTMTLLGTPNSYRVV